MAAFATVVFCVVETVFVLEVFVELAIEVVVDAVAGFRLGLAMRTRLEVIVDQRAARARSKQDAATNKEGKAKHGRKHTSGLIGRTATPSLRNAAIYQVVRHL